jgi:IS5 family transposase
MRPKQRRFFKARLDRIVDIDHPLAKLGRAIDWRCLEERFGAVYSDKAGHPPLPTRLMAGLSILKYMHDLSDEDLRSRWVEKFLLPALLLLPAQIDLRPLIADALAPANG